MDVKDYDSQIIKIRHLIKIIFFLIFVLTYCLNSNKVLGQEKNAITDFYEYANKEWLDNTTLSGNTIVVNNWGILWDEIINKSIEILSGEVQYKLDENNQYILTQLQNFYKSSAEYSKDNRQKVRLVQKHYPILFGVAFSKITISNKKEEKIKELITYLSRAYSTKLKNCNKIEDNTDFFLSRLDNMEFEIGSPNISNMPLMPLLSENSFEKNIQLSEEYQLTISNVKPDWVSPPFETDCRYNYNENKVVIYAGTLYASNFTDENNSAELFATIGRTIAHEMTHAFDKSGKKFNKKEWKNLNNSLITQFNQYAIQDVYFVNGKNTLQENFADLGGIEVSLLAFKLFLRDQHPQYSEMDNSNEIKNFFLFYSQFWREKATPEFEKSTLKRLHTPQKYRAIGPIYNQNEFYEVFEINKESRYYIPENMRISIW